MHVKEEEEEMIEEYIMMIIILRVNIVEGKNTLSQGGAIMC